LTDLGIQSTTGSDGRVSLRERRMVKVLVKWGVTVSRPVSGILSTGPLLRSGWVIIHLCGLPGENGRAAPPTF